MFIGILRKRRGNGGGITLPTITALSTKSDWSPLVTTNSGSPLTWVASGGYSETIVADDPTFDLSEATGEVYFDVSDLSQVTVWKLQQSMNITQFDGTNLIAIVTLVLRTNQIVTLDITKCILLEDFVIYTNPTLGSVDLSQNVALKKLEVYGCGLTELDVSNNTVLTTLLAYSNSITNVGLTLTPSILNLNVSINSLSGLLDLSSLVNATTVNIVNNTVTSLLLGGSVITLSIYNNNFASFDLSSEPNVKTFHAQNNDLINGVTGITTATGLITVWIQGNNLTETATNQLLADLVTIGFSGALKYRNNETGQGVTDRAQLITNGASITNYAT